MRYDLATRTVGGGSGSCWLLVRQAGLLKFFHDKIAENASFWYHLHLDE
jgi:hypothetical protein